LYYRAYGVTEEFTEQDRGLADWCNSHFVHEAAVEVVNQSDACLQRGRGYGLDYYRCCEEGDVATGSGERLEGWYVADCREGLCE
jgi:hypothetical protein